jgi:AcrR family transcriptional regulator
MATETEHVATRRRVDREQVLAAAEALVDQHGWDHLTMASLAAAVGIKVPSLYNHVPNLDAVRSELQVRTIAKLGAELQRAAMGRSGRDGIVELATVHRDFAKRHPGRYAGATREPYDREAFAAASAAGNAALLAVMRPQGLSGDEALTAELAVFASFHGFVMLETSGLLGGIVDMDKLFDLVVDAATHAFEDSDAAA